MKKLFFILILFGLLNNAIVFGDIIYLRNGRMIEGEIVEQTNEFVKINCLSLGMYAKYKKSAIAKIVLETAKSETNKNSPDGLKSGVEQPASREVLKSQIIKQEGYLLYLPQGLVAGKVYPLIVAFDPGANAQAMINFWKPIADEKKLIVYASKKFRNGQNDWFKSEEKMIEAVIKSYPVNRKRIITTGISGGGMGAHMVAYYRPDLVLAVISTVGRINPFFKTDPKAKQDYPQSKIAVFLSGTNDFNAAEMRKDQQFLSQLYWQTKWLEFKGGHEMAPQELYKQALSWIEQYW
ncbi:MAG: hypothetical protein KJ915_04115 [Candidatus Omnitrophica bacterium]|nr:hypothetical protein [Candidatus Omnitrophota bacterium]